MKLLLKEFFIFTVYIHVYRLILPTSDRICSFFNGPCIDVYFRWEHEGCVFTSIDGIIDNVAFAVFMYEWIICIVMDNRVPSINILH
jgi:hypothetical protein